MGSRAWLAGLLLVTAGCDAIGPFSGPMADLERAEHAWARAGLDSYTYTVERICFCAPDGRGPVRVRVDDGVVTERRYVDSGAPVPGALADLFPAVNGLFAIVRHALDSGAHSVSVTYDPEQGVPLELYIDYHSQMADEELGMRVTEDVLPHP